jgi:hypothetical protein
MTVLIANQDALGVFLAGSARGCCVGRALAGRYREGRYRPCNANVFPDLVQQSGWAKLNW